MQARTAIVLPILSMSMAALVLTARGDLEAQADQHAYFNQLIARRDVFKAYSLRPVPGQPITSPYYEKQLLRRADAGYAGGNSSGLWITYDPANNRDVNKQDAAKVVIPAFMWEGLYGIGKLASDIGATTDPITLVNHYGPLYQTVGKQMIIDSEIMTVYDPDGSAGPIRAWDRTTGLLYVKRAQFGTAARSHSSGVPVKPSTNTLFNAVRLPLGTTDGHTYFFTWDGYWTDSYLGNGLTNHKAFNFISDKIWFEPNANYGGGTGTAKVAGFNRATDVAAYQARTYNLLGGPVTWTPEHADYAGPVVTATTPVPQTATFVMKPNRWVRFFVRIEQRANDYDYIDSWIADEMNGPVQIHSRLPLSVRQNSLTEFVLEFGTSTEQFVRGDTRDFIAYLRNFVALVDPQDSISQFLQRPVGGAVASGPAPPRNVRIVQ